MWVSAPVELGGGGGGGGGRSGSGGDGGWSEGDGGSSGGEDWRERLLGVPVPALELSFALEGMVSLAALARRWRLGVFFHHGDSDRARCWAEHEDLLASLGCMPVSVTGQSPETQLRFAAGDLFGFMLLADPDFELAAALDLPTVTVEGERAYEPFTLLVQQERITDVLYPVDPDHELPWMLERLDESQGLDAP
jgi:peroxiredoxin